MMQSIPAVKILLVEDDPHLAPLIRLILLRIGAEAVEVAPTAAAAAALFASFRPRLVIADQNLPDEVGTALITRLRGQAEALSLPVRFVLLSGTIDTATAQAAKAARADAVLAKPVSPKLLAERLCVVLKSNP